MRKLINSVLGISMIAFLLTFAACKGGDPIIPTPNPNNGDHAELWSYDIGFGSMADITPAIDNNNNSYYSVYNGEASNVVSFGLDKDGSELWRNEIDGSQTGRVIYADNRVFITTNDPTAIYCIDAVSGNIEWSKDLSAEYDFQWIPATAFSNGKLYVSSGELTEGSLIAYNISGSEMWKKSTNLLGATGNLSVSGNALYFHDGYSLFRYNDNGTSCDSIWEYDFYNKSSRGMFAYYDLPIGDDGNIYVRDEDIHIISPNGQLINTITLDASFNEGYYSNIAITSNNDILIGKGNLVKFSNDGNIEWETDINDGIIINPAFTTAPVISSNGDFYDAQLFGLYSVKGNGTLNWKVNAENGGGTEFGNLHPPVLTHEGNIISVSSEQSIVRCFKGDGQGLASDGWPKPFGDYGNTSSK